MPVMRHTEEKPPWVEWSGFGIGIIETADQLERHFHDADEYWLVFQGHAQVLSEGTVYEIGPGDVLCTRMGDQHDILKVLEGPFKCFFIEDKLQGQKRPGHLHDTDDAA